MCDMVHLAMGLSSGAPGVSVAQAPPTRPISLSPVARLFWLNCLQTSHLGHLSGTGPKLESVSPFCDLREVPVGYPIVFLGHL